MEKIILLHGSGHRAASWDKTVSYLKNREEALCPELAALLSGRAAGYPELYAAVARYCDSIGGPVHLCGLSLGGILALNYALDFPEKVKTLVLIGTPHRIPKAAFAVQNAVFRFLPRSVFDTMAFDKSGTFALGRSMKHLDFSARVGAIRCPVLILCGERDRANLKSAQFFAQTIKGAQLRYLRRSGHTVNEDSPAALAEQLNQFYASHP